MENDSIITTSREGGVATVTLNRPARLNALTAEMLDILRATLEDTIASPEVRAILITGAGKGFCAGQDLTERDPRNRNWPLDLESIQKASFHPIIRAMRTSAKPIVVAVNGIASGAGLAIALAGDIVLAGAAARFGFSFANVGLSVDAGLGWHAVRAMGAARSRALLLRGATLTAEEALAYGLVVEVVPDADLASYASAEAARLAEGAGLAYGLIKQSVTAAEAPLEDYLAVEARLQGVAGRSDDYREGVLAFLEKRRPTFKGS